jgi:hypothetical protein
MLDYIIKRRSLVVVGVIAPKIGRSLRLEVAKREV